MSEPRRFREWLLWTGIGFGFLTGSMIFFAGTITSISANHFVAALQMVAIWFMIPGLYAAAIIGSFVPGALVNLVFYSILGGLCCLIFRKKLAPALQKENS